MIDFFVNRPIFTGVFAVVVTIAGLVAGFFLPIASYPTVAPPTIRVTATFTGGSAQAVADAVATPLEQAINGVNGLIYITSTSSSNGVATVEATFKVGYDPDVAAVDVLNRVNQATPRLPASVQERGVTIEKASPQLAAIVTIYSQSDEYDELYLANFASINVVDALNQVNGVGRTQNFSERTYAMRIWLDPDKMRYLGVSTAEVVEAIRAQNVAVAAGSIGAPPVPAGQAFELKVSTEGRLEDDTAFADIIVRTRDDGSVVRVRDVAEVELGAQSYATNSLFNGKPSAQVGVFLAPNANTLEVVSAVQETMKGLTARFSPGVEYDVAFDTSRFVVAAILDVAKTLLIAVGLVIAVTFLFLQKIRTTVVPVVVIPIALIGALAVMYVFGFSLNQLSLLGIILAVGLVVDDAIVVTENIERHLEEDEDPAPKAAARVGVKEVVGPVVATTLVLFALFVPVALTPGLTGQLYNQFALTVAFAVGLSSILALTLSPALCGVLLRKDDGQRNWFFRQFNRGFAWLTDRYDAAIAALIRMKLLVVFVFLAVGLATLLLFLSRPTGFVPQEDQGYFFINIELPAGASLERTEAVVREVQSMVAAEDGVADVIALSGFSLIGGSGSYKGFVIPIMEPWSERDVSQNGVSMLVDRLTKTLGAYPKAQVQVFNAPPVPGIGNTGGVTLQLQALADQDFGAIERVLGEFLAAANQRPEVAAAFSTFTTGVPQLYAQIDRAKVESLGVSLADVFTTLQTYLGSIFVNEFNRFGRTYRVYVQAAGWARDEPADIGRLAVLNDEGRMVPFDTFLDVQFRPGPTSVQHFDLATSAQINANPAPGVATGALITAMEEVASEVLPPDFGFAWSGVVYQQLEAGGFVKLIFALALVLVLLVLAAQFESFLMPAVIILVVPLAMFGAIGFLALFGLDLDVFGQIGLLMLIGLAAKNSILIVEFARSASEEGASPEDAARQAARLRLRPILMTALSFILGALPLMLSSGAGANARMSLGTTVVGGMLAATILSIFIIPVAYALVEDWRTRSREGAEDRRPQGERAAG